MILSEPWILQVNLLVFGFLYPRQWEQISNRWGEHGQNSVEVGQSKQSINQMSSKTVKDHWEIRLDLTKYKTLFLDFYVAFS